jgi:2,3-bisphosphoglycerate-independent phosphoglycerate mutase
MQLRLPKYRPVVLIIIDGWGVASPGPGNAITSAHTPFYNHLLAGYPNTTLQSSGEAVGLPFGEPGNSEVGHLNIGAGRIVYQDLPRINMSIANGSFLTNQTLVTAVERVRANRGRIHLMGLIGASGVHSSLEHVYALLWLFKERAFNNVFLHVFTDGRDSPPTAGQVFIPQLEERMTEMTVGRIASLSGRYFGMDRDLHWDRTARAYQAIAQGKALFYAKSGSEALSAGYAREETDEFIQSTVITNAQGRPLTTVEEGDIILSFNFRADRIRQITRAFTEQNFAEFPVRRYIDLSYITMTQYDKQFNLPIAFPPEDVQNPLARIISNAGLRQFHLAETEKYPHVTYFLNGGHEAPMVGEDRILIPSPKVATFDMEPQMSTPTLSETLIKKLDGKFYDFLVVNVAAPDMVGHSGNLQATIKAVESTDKLLSTVVGKVLSLYGAVIITADHGNAEAKLGIHGEALTSHTTNPVPFIAVSRELLTSSQKTLRSGILGDVAPTVLSLLGLQTPSSMTGRNLLSEIL